MSTFSKSFRAEVAPKTMGNAPEASELINEFGIKPLPKSEADSIARHARSGHHRTIGATAGPYD